MVIIVCVCARARACVCVCVCVRERERENERLDRVVGPHPYTAVLCIIIPPISHWSCIHKSVFLKAHELNLAMPSPLSLTMLNGWGSAAAQQGVGLVTVCGMLPTSKLYF